MSDREEAIKEMVELLKIWYSLKDSVWPAAKTALESKINELGEKI